MNIHKKIFFLLLYFLYLYIKRMGNILKLYNNNEKQKENKNKNVNDEENKENHKNDVDDWIDANTGTNIIQTNDYETHKLINDDESDVTIHQTNDDVEWKIKRNKNKKKRKQYIQKEWVAKNR
mgnify:CR=1 FL=1|jgi:hypothetical protein